jgi:hypothetical protein
MQIYLHLTDDLSVISFVAGKCQPVYSNFRSLVSASHFITLSIQW